MVLTIGPTTFKLLSVIAYEIVDPMFICFIGLCLSPLVLRAGSVSVFLSRYRFSVFGRFSQKSVSVTVSVFQNIAISVSVFGFSARTYHCLSNNIIADTLRPPLSPEWGLGPRICITNCGHKR